MRGVSSRGVDAAACGGVIDVLRRVFTGNYAETHARGVSARSLSLSFSLFVSLSFSRFFPAFSFLIVTYA